MIRRELDTMLALHAIDALPEAEVAAIEAAVAASPAVAAWLEEHRRGLVALARHGALDPPPDLKARVLAAAFAEQSPQPLVGELEPPQVVIPFARANRRPRLIAGVAVGLAVAAASAVAVVSLGDGDGGGETAGGEAIAEAMLAGPAESNLSASIFDDGRILLTGEGIPTIDADHSYQLWLIDADDEIRSAGVFAPSSEGAVDSRLNVELDDVVSLAVTVEPVGGSPVATGGVEFQGVLQEISAAD